MRTGLSTLLLLVFGLAALTLPPLALWIGYEADEELDKARDTQRELYLGALGALNAETGLRGYLLTRQEAFREPYDIGLQQVDSSSDRLDELVGDEGEVAQELDDVQVAFARWRAEFAVPAITQTRAGDLTSARSLEGLQTGEALFDEVRAHYDVLLAQLMEQTQAAEDDRDQASLVQVGLMVLATLALGGFVATLAYVLASRRRQAFVLGKTQDELEREREVSQQRKKALLEASHELRNPLTGMLLSAQILEEEAEDTGNEDLAMMAGQVVTSARRAADLVTNLLDFTRFETGRMELNSEPVAPAAIVESALEDLRMSHSDAQVELEPPSMGATVPVRGDFDRLRLVVRNLLENAYRYGLPPFRVRILSGGPQVEIHVEDSGTGVPAGERDKVFERYQRGTTSEGLDGTGIGLYMSRGIVEMHGGSIRIGTSALGGADVVVALPRAT